MKVHNALLALGLMAAISPVANLSFAQTATFKPATPIAASAPTAVPALVPYSNAVVAGDGKTFAAETGVTFQVYKDEVGGEALWTETQTVAIDSTGHYKVQLGAANPNGLPSDLFASGEARWLEVQVAGEAPQPRVLLVSVPYALKAADAATLGGLPPSAFALARPASASDAVSAVSPAIMPNVMSNVTTTGGTLGFVPEFSGTSTVVDSPIFVNPTGEVGIGTTTPTATLEVNGSTTLDGQLLLSSTGTATATKGFNSQLLKIYTSAFNSSSASVVSPRFEWEGEVTGNDTSAPGATLNLLSSTTASAATETGFHFNSNGTINFAPGQTFPGTGAGTITGVTAGTALTGGGTTGNVTLNVDTTKVPLLAAANTFTGLQTITGAEKVTGSITGGASLFLPNTSSSTIGLVELGTTPFLSNYPSGSFDAFVGGAGNFTATGSYNTGTGFGALLKNGAGIYNTADGGYSLASNVSGNYNTAIGLDSLYYETGSENTALGVDALLYDVGGSGNTAVGYLAGPGSLSSLMNATAIGANAKVSQNNSLILGQTTVGMPGNTFVNVGIGTAAPISAMEIAVSSSGAIGPALTLTNPGGSPSCCTNASDAIDFNTQPISTIGTYNPNARIEVTDDGGKSGDINFLSNIYPGSGNGVSNNGLQTNMTIWGNGNGVSIGTSQEAAQLEVVAAEGEGIDVFGGEQADGSMTQGVLALRVGGGTSTGTDQGGLGAWIIGGDSENTGTSGEGLLVWPGEPAFGEPVGLAADFEGNVEVDGTLTANLKNFKIDHPLDPANKYLVHASVESSEMMNIYSGNVTTDDLGLATVTLPEWFQAENGDFRYQLTVIGGRFAQAIVSKEIANNQFTISTNATNVKVSWQVTAVRQDAYAKANPMVVEEIKPANERGFYQHPELYGQPKEKQTEWGRHPAMVAQWKAEKAKMKQGLLSSARKTATQSSAPASAVNRNFPHPAAPAIQPATPGAQLKPISQVETK